MKAKIVNIIMCSTLIQYWDAVGLGLIILHWHWPWPVS